MKTPTERIAEAAFARMPDGEGESWRVRFARAIAAEVLRELLNIVANESIHYYAASLGVELSEKEESK